MSSPDLIPALHHALADLTANPYPYVPNPPGCKKRASVAVIIRIRPAYTTPPQLGQAQQDNPAPPTSLDEFFSKEWVQSGSPEILFIKRAGRPGDRWSGHVALPGGKRDPSDASDSSAAIRETLEEVGLDLSQPSYLPCGNLPERVVATTWGREALMVLCPFLFLFTGQDIARARPQPTEVAAAHWVPLQALLSENLRTREYVDTASRMARQGGVLAQTLLRLLVGRMVFSAVHLLPSESVYASSIDECIPSTPENWMLELALGALPLPVESARRKMAFQQPLLLWGLTLGVLADFLDMLPPGNAVRLWRYPTFTPPDLRFLIWLLTRRLRVENANDLSAGTFPSGGRRGSQTVVDATVQAVAVTEAEPSRLVGGRSVKEGPWENEVGISGLGVTSKRKKDAVSRLLAGYYERVHVAIVVFTVYRVVVGSAGVWWLVRWWRGRR